MSDFDIYGEDGPAYQNNGALEIATRTVISQMGVMDGINRALAELAIILAQKLDARDGGKTGMAISANSKELRETLKQMQEASDGGNAIDDLLERLSGPVPSEVRNPTNPGKADARR